MKKASLLRSLILFVLLFAGFYGRAQTIQKFSGDSTKFIGELNTYFSTLSDADRKIVQEGMITFIQNWNADKFDPPKKKIIYGVSNNLLKRRVRPFPDFYNYISSLNAFLQSRQPDNIFYAWSEILAKLGESKNSRNLLLFLDQATNLFGKQLLYESPSTSWKLSNPEYQFSYDTVPFISVKETDLTCYSNRDSLVIYKTRGRYYPLTTQWIGVGGKVDWQRANLDPGQVFAKLHEYSILMKYSKYMADSVEFINSKYLRAPLIGQLIDKVQADITEEKASYPRFYSSESYIEIPNVLQGIDFYGGFGMEGAKVVGTGTSQGDAELSFKKDGKDFLVARSQSFIIRPDRINSGSASISILHEGDSIYHAGLQLKYIDELKELSLTRDDRIAVLSPWYDSWHNIEIYCEALYWKRSDSLMSFEVMRGPGTMGKATMESANYYTLDRYEMLQGIDEVNPLMLIKSYTEKKKTREFTVGEIAKYMQKSESQVESLLLLLSSKGFLIYDQDTKRAVVKDKLVNYVDARNGRRDYDVIFFNSNVEGKSNALLNLNTFDLTIEGVDKVAISDSQQVYIYPKNQKIVMQQGMNFAFSGKIEAGLFDFYARGCSFEYGSFKINLPDVDTMEFYTRGNKVDPKTGEFPMVKVRSALNGLSGTLLIDDPGNKSGLKFYPQYPIFTNRDTSFVHWDKSYVYKGAYDKERFFYEVYPFTLRSLDMMNPDTLRFRGALTSAGIFPRIEEPLKIRGDYSLGFEKTTPAEGLPIYSGKGTFISRIDLSNQGLHGDGIVKYLTSSSVSKDFIFFPDSMSTVARSFIVTEQLAAVEYPNVMADSVTETWLPYKDSLAVHSMAHDMTMYNGQSVFSGGLGITPAGVYGTGTIRIKDSEMDSKNFSFKHHSFDALIANFRIKSYDLAALSISTKNYKAHFDFALRQGEFKSNLGISVIEFPFNQYICTMDRFDWHIDNEVITLTNEQSIASLKADTGSLVQVIDREDIGARFTSVHPLQDSLRFYAQSATYNLRTSVINAEGVRILRIADAAIFPDSGKVCILKNAQMRVLENASLIVNTKDRFHNIYRAKISVATRKKYSGEGIIDYTERTGEREQILLSSIKVDSSGTTVAKGNVPDSAAFRLSPEFAFSGEVSLKATEKFLGFNGGYRVITDCFGTPPQWVRFESGIDPEKVMLPVTDNLRNLKSERLTAGLVMSPTQGRIYAAFFDQKRSFSDSVMIRSYGNVEYQPEKAEFRIAPPKGTSDRNYPPETLLLNTKDCKVQGEGKINLGMVPGNLKIESYGTLDHYVIPDSTNARVAIALNFPFLADALDKFRLQLMAVNLPGVTVFNSPYGDAMTSLLPKGDAEKLRTEVEQFGRFRKFPEELVRTLFLADVKLSWDSVSKSYVSYGPIGIGSIRNELVNRYVEGKIEFAKKRNGDDFTIYLKLTKDDWYFFNYRNNIMQVISSNLEFNDLIIKAQQDKSEMNRIDKEAKGYRYTISTERKKRDFLRRFEVSDE